MTQKQDSNWIGGLMLFVAVLIGSAVVGVFTTPAATMILSGLWIAFLVYLGITKNQVEGQGGYAMIMILFWTASALLGMGIASIVFNPHLAPLLVFICNMIGLIYNLGVMKGKETVESQS